MKNKVIKVGNVVILADKVDSIILNGKTITIGLMERSLSVDYTTEEFAQEDFETFYFKLNKYYE